VYRDIPGELRQMIEPVIEDHGCELVNATVAHRPTIVRVTVDTESGDGQVGVDVCARISRELGTHMDATDAIGETYRLEVSSPGLHRVLARPKDFTRACGSVVKLTTRTGIEGRRRFQGCLVSFDGNFAELDVDNSRVRIPFEEIERANTVYQFAAKDFDNRVVRPVSERL